MVFLYAGLRRLLKDAVGNSGGGGIAMIASFWPILSSMSAVRC